MISDNHKKALLLAKSNGNTQYDAKLRSREERTQDEADLSAEILAEALVELSVDASRPPAVV